MSETESADVVVVGGGIIGSAVAYHLTRAGVKRVVIVERDPSYAACSTARSAGGIRQQFSTPENIALSRATLSLLTNLTCEFGSDAQIPFHEQGYLILASQEGRAILDANAATQRAAGAATEVLDTSALAQSFPWLALDGVAAGSFGPIGEGWADPLLLMSLLRKAAQAHGATLITGDVTAIEHDATRIAAVRLADGHRIVCGALVNAAGPAAGALAKIAGIALPVEPRKRQIFVIDSRRATEDLRQAPLTVDPGGVWFRPEGRTFLCGISPSEDNEPPAVNLDDIDHREFEDVVWPALAARVPAFEEAKVRGAWAGFYDYNTLDQNGIIGAHPRVRNFYFANGFSGHGFQQGYGAGRAVSELIVHGCFKTIDLTRFGYARIAARVPLLELNVI